MHYKNVAVKVDKPKVSVCIPTYNRANLLAEAVDSVVAQTFTDFELVISDNASEDDTSSVVSSYRDARIRYVRNERNRGHRENWNQCLRLARGEYITILPDDDLMMPENLAAKVAILSKHPTVGLVHSKYHLIDGQGRIVKCNTNEGHGEDRTTDAFEEGQDVLTSMLLSYNMINAPTVLFRRECYEKLGGFAKRLSLAFDWEYWMRIAVYYDVAFVAQPLIKWRIHPGSLTTQNIHIDGETLTITALREELAAKRLILKQHSHAIENASDLKKLLWVERISRIVDRGERMLGDGGPNKEVRKFVTEMCRVFPEILMEKHIWKIFVKSMLSRQMVEMLKGISPI